MAAGWCSGTSFIWARSIRPRRKPGARRSRLSTRRRAAPRRWLCFPRIVARPWRTIPRWCGCICPNFACIVRGNGVPVGWPGSCGETCNSIGSGPSACRRAGSERAGTTFCKSWSPTGRLNPPPDLIRGEWRLHREWFGNSAMADLLGSGFGLAAAPQLFACHDLLLAHKDALFLHLTERWRDLFNADFDVLLYDLTSTYFEVNASDLPEGSKRRHGYSRDKRPDCPQLVIALVVTAEGLPLAYEVLPGNTADSKTLRTFLSKIEKQYGKARRVWVMDRGVPTEAVLAEMRASDPPVQYLVGTPKGRLNRLEKHLIEKPWQKARAGVEVKLLAQDDELYVFAQSADRVAKERAMRRRQLKWLWARLGKLAAMNVKREEMLMKLGAARSKAPTAWRLVEVALDKESAELTFSLNRQKLRIPRRREGRYLLRTNLTDKDPAVLWQYYVQLVAVEEAFKNLKGDLAIRPIFHHDESRIEAHIFIAFLAYALQVTLTRRLHALAPGLTARSALEKFAAVQMIDVHLPTTDGREIVLTRYTQPEPELELLINQLKLTLPSQPPPKITAAALAQITPRSEDLS